jgi:hypothetical protein
MSDVRVTIGANSAPLESEFEKVKNSARGLKKSVGDVGGVLEGDRRVENKMTAFVEGFKSAQNGADLLANTMGNLGDVFKSSLAIGVGLNVGAALVGMISDVIKESDELRKAAKAAGDELRAALTAGDSGALESAIKKANVELDKLAKKASGIFTGTSGADKSKLFDEKLLAGSELIKLAKDELEIQKLIAEEEWDKADALAEEARLAKERAKISSLNLPMFQHNELVSASNDASELRLEAKREERRKAQAQKDEQAAKEAANQAAKAEEAEKKAMDAAEKLRLGFITTITEAEIAAMRETAKVQEMVERGVIKAVEQAENEHRKALADADDKDRKEREAKDKAELEKKQENLKNAEGLVKKGAQEQKQRDDRAVQGLLRGEGLTTQRVNDRAAELAKEKAAGIAARDEVRRKYGGDATKMSKAEIEAVKNRMLGEKPLNQKEIAAAAKAIPKMQAAIDKLVQKLGVK